MNKTVIWILVAVVVIAIILVVIASTKKPPTNNYTINQPAKASFWDVINGMVGIVGNKSKPKDNGVPPEVLGVDENGNPVSLNPYANQ